MLKCNNSETCIDKLYQSCGHVVGLNKNILKQLLKKSTVNNEMLVINGHAFNSELSNTLFWYKADYTPESKTKLSIKNNDLLNNIDNNTNDNNNIDYYSINNSVIIDKYTGYTNTKGSYGIILGDSINTTKKTYANVLIGQTTKHQTNEISQNIVISHIEPLIPINTKEIINTKDIINTKEIINNGETNRLTHLVKSYHIIEKLDYQE
jgi:hypothetical protein